MTQAPGTSGKRRPMLLLLLAASAGILFSLVLARVLQPEPAATVSEVEREVRRIVLYRSDRPGIEHGGAIGPWRVSADSVDEVTGEFRHFHLRSGLIRLAAKSAELRIDPESSSISFVLHDVVYARVPDRRDDAAFDHALLDMERYVLGPVPYKRKIVRDGEPTQQPSFVERLVGLDPTR